MSDDTVTPPPKETPVHRPHELDEAVTAIDEAEASEEDAALVLNGVRIYPLRVTGLDKQRIRIATNGYLSETSDLINQAYVGDLEAIAALYYVFRLKEDELKPSQASYSYEDCLEAIDIEKLADVMRQLHAAVEDDG